MPKLPLTFACGLYDRMLALHTGEVQVEGVDLNFLVDDNPRNIFDRIGTLFSGKRAAKDNVELSYKKGNEDVIEEGQFPESGNIM